MKGGVKPTVKWLGETCFVIQAPGHAGITQLLSVLMGKQQQVAWSTNDTEIIGQDEQEATHADLGWVMACRWCDAMLCLMLNAIQQFPNWLHLAGKVWSPSSRVSDAQQHVILYLL